MIIVAVIVGLLAGLIAWCGASYFVVHSVVWIESRRPELVGSKALRAFEVAVCSGLVLACFALGFWVARLLWMEGR